MYVSPWFWLYYIFYQRVLFTHRPSLCDFNASPHLLPKIHLYMLQAQLHEFLPFLLLYFVSSFFTIPFIVGRFRVRMLDIENFINMCYSYRHIDAHMPTLETWICLIYITTKYISLIPHNILCMSMTYTQTHTSNVVCDFYGPESI